MEIIQVTEPEQTLRCADIWLEASLAGQPFMGEDFWRRHHAAMGEQYLPAADVYAAMISGADGVGKKGGISEKRKKAENPGGDAALVGFAALHRRKLAALFVLPVWWGRGVGSALLRHVQGIYGELHLTVYEENARAVRFYHKHGFTTQGTQLCPHTGAPECRMAWRRPYLPAR